MQIISDITQLILNNKNLIKKYKVLGIKMQIFNRNSIEQKFFYKRLKKLN